MQSYLKTFLGIFQHATAGASVLFLLFFFPKTVFVKRKMQNVSELSLSFQMHCIIH